MGAKEEGKDGTKEAREKGAAEGGSLLFHVKQKRRRVSEAKDGQPTPRTPPTHQRTREARDRPQGHMLPHDAAASPHSLPARPPQDQSPPPQESPRERSPAPAPPLPRHRRRARAGNHTHTPPDDPHAPPSRRRCASDGKARAPGPRPQPDTPQPPSVGLPRPPPPEAPVFHVKHAHPVPRPPRFCIACVQVFCTHRPLPCHHLPSNPDHRTLSIVASQKSRGIDGTGCRRLTPGYSRGAGREYDREG